MPVKCQAAGYAAFASSPGRLGPSVKKEDAANNGAFFFHCFLKVVVSDRLLHLAVLHMLFSILNQLLGHVTANITVLTGGQVAFVSRVVVG